MRLAKLVKMCLANAFFFFINFFVNFYFGCLWLSTYSHLRCSSAVPNFGGQKFRLQEESISGVDTLTFQTRPYHLGNGKSTMWVDVEVLS